MQTVICSKVLWLIINIALVDNGGHKVNKQRGTKSQSDGNLTHTEYPDTLRDDQDTAVTPRQYVSK